MADADHERWAVEVGPYVLGSLDPHARARFEDHAATCAACRAEVSALAGLPGLLDRVSADVVDELEGRPGAERAEPPPLLLADLLRVARREERARA
uniref:zf-HC2 domain-containing protein n=1 Tax=Actinotalea sp. JY-7885 TaxID=2758576 RepID=UPI001CB6E401